MFDKMRAKIGLAIAGKAWFDSVGDPKMTPEKEYQLTIGLWKAIITFLKQFASCTTISAYMDGVVIPSTWDEFRAKWMTIAIPIVWGLIKVVMNAYKQGAFSGKAVASVALAFALLASPGCASLNSMSAADKAALMSAAVASVTAAGVQVSAAIDAHKQAQQERDIEAANAKIEQAQKQLDIAVGAAEEIKQIVAKPTAAPATP